MEKIWGSFDLSMIEKLADMVSEKELSEISLTDGDKNITIKGRKCPPPPPIAAMPVPALTAPLQGAAPAAAAAAGDTPASDMEGNIVKAPIVGTFYSSPSPDKPAFVKVGTRVKKGDVLMIIESMKVMNEIKSEFDGTVKKILVKTGAAVEYDQPIMVIA